MLLQKLHLKGCGLSGSIPAELMNCAALEDLDLSDNKVRDDVKSQTARPVSLTFGCPIKSRLAVVWEHPGRHPKADQPLQFEFGAERDLWRSASWVCWFVKSRAFGPLGQQIFWRVAVGHVQWLPEHARYLGSLQQHRGACGPVCMLASRQLHNNCLRSSLLASYLRACSSASNCST